MLTDNLRPQSSELLDTQHDFSQRQRNEGAISGGAGEPPSMHDNEEGDASPRAPPPWAYGPLEEENVWR